jgi:hypothetical protein
MPPPTVASVVLDAARAPLRVTAPSVPPWYRWLVDDGVAFAGVLRTLILTDAASIMYGPPRAAAAAALPELRSAAFRERVLAAVLAAVPQAAAQLRLVLAPLPSDVPPDAARPDALRAALVTDLRRWARFNERMPDMDMQHAFTLRLGARYAAALQTLPPALGSGSALPPLHASLEALPRGLRAPFLDMQASAIAAASQRPSLSGELLGVLTIMAAVAVAGGLGSDKRLGDGAMDTSRSGASRSGSTLTASVGRGDTDDEDDDDDWERAWADLEAMMARSRRAPRADPNVELAKHTRAFADALAAEHADDEDL